MRYHYAVVHALVVCAAIGASAPTAKAQFKSANRYAQNTAPPMAGGSSQVLPTPQSATAPSMAPIASGGYASEGCSGDQCYSAGSCGYGDSCPCGDSCGSSCGSGCCDFGSCGGNSGSWFFTGDYLNVRAHFSDATAYIRQVDTNTTPATTTQTFHQLEFDRESSFRVGGGYKLCCCGEEIAFNFTQLRSSADDSVTAPARGSGSVVVFPYDTNILDPDNGQQGIVRASVDVDTYDLVFRKTIPLGGSSCSNCGDPCSCGDGCGCGDCCKPSCPAWDITWSGGVRAADVEWNRAYLLRDPVAPASDTNTRQQMNFDGVGPRAGLEGRRYFGHDGWFSIFLKGDLSLLWGHVDLQTVQETFIPGAEQATRESLRVQEIIPVTEFEAGMSASVTCHSMFSAGYMLSAWHDLGFRSEPVRANVVLNNGYDDANIMSFDGFFARVEWNY